MAVSWSDVTAIAPPLSAVPSGTQTVILAAVSAQLSNASYWPTTALYELAQKYLAAHMGTLYLRSNGGGDASGGPVASESVGDVSVSYMTAPAKDAADAWYTLTPWGLALQALSLRSVMRRGPMVV